MEGAYRVISKEMKIKTGWESKVTQELGLDHPSQLITNSYWDLLLSFLIHVKKLFKLQVISSHSEGIKSQPEGIQVMQDPAFGKIVNIYALQMLYSLWDSYAYICGHEYYMVFWNTSEFYDI